MGRIKLSRQIFETRKTIRRTFNLSLKKTRTILLYKSHFTIQNLAAKVRTRFIDPMTKRERLITSDK